MSRSDLTVPILLALAARHMPQLLADIRNRKRPPLLRGHCAIRSWHLAVLWLAIVLPAICMTALSQDRCGLLAVVGLLLVIVGGLLGYGGFRQLGSAYSTELVIYPDSRLICSGLYGVIRHPIRLGLALETLGVILISSQVGLIGLWLIYCAGLILRSRAESTLLRDHFGDSLAAYHQAVPAVNVFKGLVRYLSRSGNSSRRAATDDGARGLNPAENVHPVDTGSELPCRHESTRRAAGAFRLVRRSG